MDLVHTPTGTTLIVCVVSTDWVSLVSVVYFVEAAACKSHNYVKCLDTCIWIPAQTSVRMYRVY